MSIILWLIKNILMFIKNKIQIVIAIVMFITLIIFNPLIGVSISESISEVETESLFAYKRLIYACIFATIVTIIVINVIISWEAQNQINEYNSGNYIYNDKPIIFENNVKVYDSTNMHRIYHDLALDKVHNTDLSVVNDINQNKIYYAINNSNYYYPCIYTIENTTLNKEWFYKLPEQEQIEFIKAYLNNNLQKIYEDQNL